MAQQRGPLPPSRRGDFTGNKKEALLQEHAAQVDARREELGIVSQQTQSIKDDGVVDLMSGRPVLEHPDAEIDGAGLETDPRLTPDGVHIQAPSPEPLAGGTKIGSGTSSIDVFEFPEERVQASAPQGSGALTTDQLNAPSEVKVLYDLEEVTIGYGNTFNLRAGYRYKVPRWVAMHLEEKGLAMVLSLNVA